MAKYINFIPIRHGLTCANILYFGLEENNRNLIQEKINQHSSDTNICRIGVEQCLQLSDFLMKRKEEGYDYIFGNAICIKPNNECDKKPLTIFCCSELRRTQETLYVSLIRYLPEYLKNGGRIMVLPILNEDTDIDNMDNFPENYEYKKENWKIFIKNLRIFFNNYLGNLGNSENKFDLLLEEDWDKIFYLNPIIYEPFLKNKKLNPFSNKGKILKNYKNGLCDIDNLKNIIDEYCIKHSKKNESINLVMMTHFLTMNRFLDFIYPTSREDLEKQQLMNCEMIKLPKYDLVKKEFIVNIKFEDCRLFPVGFQKMIIKRPMRIPYFNEKSKIHNYFIFYDRNFNLFFSILDLINFKTFKVGSENKISIKKPLKKYIKMDFEDYLNQIKVNGDYYKILEKLVKFYGKKNNYFYNYQILLDILIETNNVLNIVQKNRRGGKIKLGEIFSKEKIFKNFLGMCDPKLIKECKSFL